MKIGLGILCAVLSGTMSAATQSAGDTDFKLALPDHKGQIAWKAEGFQIVESSAKPDGGEKQC